MTCISLNPGQIICKDDHTQQLRSAYNQMLPRTNDGGRKMLLLCPYCRFLWLQVGRGASYVRLTYEQERAALKELRQGYDGTAIPTAICRVCAISLGGICKVEELYAYDRDANYLRMDGYRLIWVGVRPEGAHLLCSIARTDASQIGTVEDQVLRLLSMMLDVPISPDRQCREFMDWLKALSCPVDTYAYSSRVKEAQAKLDPPGHAFARKSLKWCGQSWIAHCPVLGGEVIVSLAMALSPMAVCPPEKLVSCWSRLASLFEAAL